MPCNGGHYFDHWLEAGSDEQIVDQKIRIQTLTSQLCSACKLIEEAGLGLPKELDEWWYEHKLKDEELKAEAKRRAEAVSAKQRREEYLASVKVRLVSQLSEDELEAIGIERISQLEHELEKATFWADKQNFFRSKEDIANELDLPVPRLQVELTIHSPSDHEWRYSLIHSTYWGSIEAHPMSQSNSMGSHKYCSYQSLEDVMGSMPSRMLSEVMNDVLHLKIPGYAIVPGGSWLLKHKDLEYE